MSTALAQAFVQIRPDVATFKGETASSLGGVGGSIGDQITKDANGRLHDSQGKFVKTGEDIGKSTGKSFAGGFTPSIKGIAETLGAAFVAEKAVDFFKDAVKDANEYKSVTNLTAAAIKSTGGAAHVTSADVADLAEHLSNTDAVSKGAAQSVADMVLRFQAIKNVGPDKIFDDTTTAALNMAAATGKSATSAATQLGRALSDPTKNLGALTRSGITFSAGQTDVIKKLAASGHLLAAQKIILGQVSAKYGGAAAAAATPLDKLKNSANELELAVGQQLIPRLNTLAEDGTKAFTWAQQNPKIVKDIAIAVGILSGALLVYSATTKVVAAGQAIAAGAAKLFAASEVEVDAAMDANPIGLVVVAIAALAAGLIYAYKHSQTFRNIVNASFGAVVTDGKALVSFFRTVIPPVFAFVKNTFLKYTILGLVISHFGQIRSFVTTSIHDVIAVVSELASLPGKANAWFGGMETGAKNKLGALLGYVNGIPGRIVADLGNTGHLLVGAGENLITGFISGITSKISDVKSTLGGLTSKLKDWKGPPARDAVILHGAGQTVIEGFVRGLESRYGAVKNSLAGLTAGIAPSPSFAMAGGSYGNTTGSAARAAANGQPIHVHLTLDGHEVATAMIGPLGQLVGNRPLP